MTKKLKILNVGCGNETYGTHFVDLYPSRKEVIKCDVDKEKLPFRDNFFNEVYSAFLIEHLKNPGFALKEMTRVLKKGGKLVIKTDNASFWLYHISLPFKVCQQHYGGYESKGLKDKHYSIFTTEHLKNHLTELSLKIKKSEYFGKNYDGLKKKWLGRLYLLLSSFLYRTRIFRRMAYKHILIEAEK
jgi:predicted SAM-dependent methyltransferase